MASPKSRHKEHRASAIGKDIFSRMLMIEKESKQRRASISPTSPPLPTPSLRPLPPKSPVVHTRPLPERNHNSAETTVQSLKVDTEPSIKDDASEICLSPTWSGHGEKKPKKPAKRLSKKPPAAMDTQKMAAGLRRNSLVSFLSTSSREGSRRNSREEKRSSIVSFTSRRSQSTPASSTEDWTPIVSSSAPRLPKFPWHSRASSKAGSINSDDAYERDLVAFAYRLDSTMDESKPAPKMNRSQTEPDVKMPLRETAPLREAKSNSIKDSRPPKLKDEDIKQHQQAKANTKQKITRQPKSPVSPPGRPSLDGSSYVHKQRMYQQQMSIAGFQEQQVVEQANEAAKSEMEEPRETPLPPPPPSQPVLEPTDNRRTLGFRRRTKPPPSNVWIPTEEESKSKFEKMMESPKIPFRGRRDSAGSMGSARSHSRTRTASSQLIHDPIVIKPEPKQMPSVAHSPVKSEAPTPKAAASPTRPEIKSKSVVPEAKPVPPSKPASTGIPKPESPTTSTKPRNSSPLRPSMPKASTAPIISTTDPPASAPLPQVTKPEPELVITTASPEGLIRKTSITRHRSNPQLQTQSTATNSLPNLDFLPQLKHQPFTKSSRRLSSTPSSPGASPVPSVPDLTLMPKSPLRASPSTTPPMTPPYGKSATTASLIPPTISGRDSLDAKPIAKMFVICCKCRFWHDLPSKLYESMALPKDMLSNAAGKPGTPGSSLARDSNAVVDKAAGTAETRLDTAVKCPWCDHGMTTWCCQGWTGVVYLHKRHH